MRSLFTVTALCLLVVAGCGDSLPPEADLSPTGVTRASDAIVPLLRSIAGTWSAEPVAVEVVTQEVAVRRVADVLRRSRVGIQDGRAEAIEDQLASLAVHAHPVQFDPASGNLILVEGGLGRLAGITAIGTSATRQAYLDVLLAEGLARAELHRSSDLIEYLAAARNEEEWVCRRAAIAGLAQYLVRRIAAAREASTGQELQRAVFHLLVKPGTDPAVDGSTRDLTDRMRFELVQGERFFEDLVEHVGFEEARVTILRAPPVQLPELRDIDSYLARSTNDRILRAAAERLALELEGPGYSCESRLLSRSELLAATRPADPGLVESAVRGVGGAMLLFASPKAPGQRIILLVTRCRDSQAARHWLAASRTVMQAKDQAMKDAQVESPLISATYEELESVSRPGYRVLRNIRQTSGEELLYTLVLAENLHVIEVTGNTKPSVEDIAARALEVLGRIETEIRQD